MKLVRIGGTPFKFFCQRCMMTQWSLNAFADIDAKPGTYYCANCAPVVLHEHEVKEKDR